MYKKPVKKSKNAFGRGRHRRDDNIKVDYKKCGNVGWIELAQRKVMWTI